MPVVNKVQGRSSLLTKLMTVTVDVWLACRAVCLQLKSFLVTVGTEEMCRRQDHSFFGCNQSRSFYIISVLRKCFLSCVFHIFTTIFWEKVNGCRVILLLLILYDTLVSVTELFAKDRKYDDLLPYLTCRGTSHGHHQQFWEV